MTKIKNWIWLILVFAATLTGAIILTSSSLIDFEQINELGADLHYNLISTSTTIGGFLFTAVSILFSVISNKNIERLWNNDYLSNLYRAAAIGIVANVATILAALTILLVSVEESTQSLIIKIEIISVLVSLVFFAWSLLNLVLVFADMKK